MVQDESGSELPQILKKLVRDTSLSRLRALSNKVDIDVQELNEDREILAHWMAVILVSGRNLRITFKTQFSTGMAQCFAGNSFKLEKEDVTKSQAQDFIREYCNLVAGYLKNALDQQQVVVGISLPLLARGFDDLFFKFLSARGVVGDRWKLVVADMEIFCSVSIEIIDEFSLNAENLEFADSGDVEFF